MREWLRQARSHILGPATRFSTPELPMSILPVCPTQATDSDDRVLYLRYDDPGPAAIPPAIELKLLKHQTMRTWALK